MQIYHYNQISGEFLKAEPAKLDPLETELQGTEVFLLPANATEKSPPATGENEVAVFLNDSWIIEPDHRGETWFKAYNEPVVISDIGDPVSEGLAMIEPLAPAPTTDDVNLERDRRQLIAVPVQVNAETSFYVDVDDKSRTFILAVTEMANIITASGSSETIDFTGADNTTRTLSPDEIRLMSVQVFQELARIQAKSRQIKDMTPIPSDYTDDQYWT